MKSTTTVHWNTGSIAREHNERDEELCKNEPHIDLKNEHGFSFHEVLFRQNLHDAYEQIFGDEIDAYNAKQKRRDRHLTVDDYMQSIVNDNRGRKQRTKKNGKSVIKEDARQGKQLSYEITYKVGNTERKRKDDGRTSYHWTGHHFRPEFIEREIQQESLRRYYQTFQKRNPNLRIINADLHCDEGFYNAKGVWEYACDGLHLEVVPVASGFKQGLFVQNSMNKAMHSMGFDGVNAYADWSLREQDYLAEIVNEVCKERHKEPIEFYHPVKDKTKQGGLDKDEFIEMQELQERKAELENYVCHLKDIISRLQAQRTVFSDEMKKDRLKFKEERETANTALERKWKMLDKREKDIKAKEDELVEIVKKEKEALAECETIRCSLRHMQQPVAYGLDAIKKIRLRNGRTAYDVYTDAAQQQQQSYNEHIKKYTDLSFRQLPDVSGILKDDTDEKEY